MSEEYQIRGMKLVEIPFLSRILENQSAKDDILVIGERVGTEGIIQTVIARDFNECVCTDIMPLGETLEKITNRDNRVKFVQQDFVDMPEERLFDFIVCINVLEHFGMNFSEFPGFSNPLGDDYIRWNHDLRAIQKMIKLLKNKEGAKIIITVPAGSPILSGDINEGNKMPFLRRYDFNRIELIHDMVDHFEMNIESMYFYSQDLNEWFLTDKQITKAEHFRENNPFTPNIIWGFVLTHKTCETSKASNCVVRQHI